MSSDLIVVEERDGYAILRINREDKRNAMSRDARCALMMAMESVCGRVKAIVLTGTGGSFCAGLDLKEGAADHENKISDEPLADWNEINLAIRRHPAVLIAAGRYGPEHRNDACGLAPAACRPPRCLARSPRCM